MTVTHHLVDGDERLEALHFIRHINMKLYSVPELRGRLELPREHRSNYEGDTSPCHAMTVNDIIDMKLRASHAMSLMS